MSGWWGAGFIAPDGTDYVAWAAEQIRTHMGIGLYDQDPHATMSQWRDVAALALAPIANYCDVMFYESVPNLSTYTLTYWEWLFGSPLIDRDDATRTIQERRRRLREKVSHHLSDTIAGDYTVTGIPSIADMTLALDWIHRRWTGGGILAFLLTGPAQWTLQVSPNFWKVAGAEDDLNYWLAHLTPAWGKILVV